MVVLKRQSFTMRHRRRSGNPTWQQIWTFCHRWQYLLLSLPLLPLLATIGWPTQPSSKYLRSVNKASQIRLASFPPSSDELDKLNAQLIDADDILKWTVKQIPNHRLIQVTSFGPSGLVILHKLQRLDLLSSVPAVTIDTLHLFPETYEFISQTKETFTSMDLHVFRPDGFEDRDDFDEDHGEDLWQTNPDLYSYLTKVEPLMRAIDELKASVWITGRRSSQGGERASLNVFEIDNLDESRLKINPLAHWSYDDVWDYIRKHKIPYNPLHDQGYKSIGDEMTTIAASPEEDERSGRFVGLNTTECGMHLHLEKIKKMKQEAEKQSKVFKMPSLPCSDCLKVDSESFDKLVVEAENVMLLEFFSPMCGACRHFAPEYKQIAKKLKPINDIAVARFDITNNDISDSMRKTGFDVAVTPSLYLVQRNPFRVSLYDGKHDVTSILEWLEKKHSSFKLSDLQT